MIAALVPGKGGGLVSLTPDGKKLYFSNAAPCGTEVVVIDLEKRTVATRIKTGN